MGVVYHANYLRYFEVGRVEMLRARNVSYRALEERGVRLAVVDASSRFHSPARFDDLLAIECRVERVRATRIDLAYSVTREDDGQPRLLAQGVTVLACLDAAGKPRRLPDDLKAALGAERAP
jgi:acyl-CoA thioester hydrolase